MLRLTAFAASILLLPLIAHAERYSVEEDSFGGFSAKKVESSEQSEPSTTTQPLSEPVSETPVDTKRSVEATTPAPKEKPSADDKIIGDVGKKLSPFEKAYIESEKRERAKVLEALKNAPKSAGTNLTDVNPDDFVDGEELLRKGSRAASEGTSYYTMVEADGTVRNVQFDADAVSEALDREAQKTIEFTEADILLKSASKLDLPESADPIAAKLFGGEGVANTYFQKFSKSCCDNLPLTSTPALEIDKSFYHEFGDGQLPFRFAGGDSRFLLLSLPQTKRTQPLKLRTFIRRHKQFGIENGVFFPQLVTLDKEMQPLRIFTGPLLKYHGETWLAHGYLEGFFEIDSTESGAEKYLLINTTREIQRQESNIVDESGSTLIEHMGIGTIELELLRNP
jgi:hypothetical protein